MAQAPGLQGALQTKLQQIIASNQLQSFYPPQVLQQVMARLNAVDFRYEGGRLCMVFSRIKCHNPTFTAIVAVLNDFTFIFRFAFLMQ